MEMYFERVTAAIPSAEWNKLVADVNAAFGMNRRPDNVKNHWNTKAKGCLLSGYQCQE